ncbi:UNVERIFIED_CONTAM: hypothetical protein Scaly_2926000 [Sesamum calycinum]|uniref:Gag/pol protein n=1 Tax=Sesamum calycinum TaxID=2727403 RepID=A0AAW2KWR6_9LAMI
MRHGIKLSKKQSPKINEKLKRMLNIPYALVVGSLQYAFQCTRSDVVYVLSVTSRYQACTGETHWSTVKTILKRCLLSVFVPGSVHDETSILKSSQE